VLQHTPPHQPEERRRESARCATRPAFPRVAASAHRIRRRLNRG
jgi:hypothetical protein